MKQLEQEFIRGVVYSAAFLIRANEDSIALELLTESGLTYADLKKAKCDIFDLEYIEKLMKRDSVAKRSLDEN